MKKLVMAFILSITLSGNAQDLNNWQIGFNVNPFIFNRINKDYEPQKAKQDFPNGFGYGLTIEKNWNEHWGVKSGFEFSKQNQKYDKYPYTGNVYETKVNADFKYYKIPITLQYYYPITEKLFLICNQGLQLSLLNDYKTVLEDPIGYTIITPNYKNFYDPIGNINYPRNNYGWIYKRQTYGLIGSIGLKGFLTDKISYSTNMRYEYDLSTSDSDKNFFSNNPNTKNFRLGLELGMQYNFSLNNYRFNKQPHKI